MSFIWKSIRDSDFKHILNPCVLRISRQGPLKNLVFSKFWPPSSILEEMENVVYLENHKRYSDFGKFSTSWVPRTTRTSEKLRLLPISAAILNFRGNGKCHSSGKP